MFIKTTKTDRFRLVSITDRAVQSLGEQLDTATETPPTTSKPSSNKNPTSTHLDHDSLMGR